MDNLISGKPGGNVNLDKPIPLDNVDKPIPLAGGSGAGGGVSRAPLNLGGGSSPAQAERIEAPRPVLKSPAVSITSGDRITGIKTFFTKLHPGAIEFLDEQISTWLKQNPGIRLKQTNVVTGEVQAKKSEPNIVITVWY